MKLKNAKSSVVSGKAHWAGWKSDRSPWTLYTCDIVTVTAGLAVILVRVGLKMDHAWRRFNCSEGSGRWASAAPGHMTSSSRPFDVLKQWNKSLDVLHTQFVRVNSHSLIATKI